MPKVKLDSLKKEYQAKINFIRSLNYNQRIEKIEIVKEWKTYFNQVDKLFGLYSESPQYLSNNAIANIVSDSIHFYNGKEYDLICFCIMPNHVHFIIKLSNNSKTVDRIMQSIKSYSARKSNEILDRKGQFWQHENYDHIIRNESEFENIIEYVLNNPVKAGLVKEKTNWKWNNLVDLDL